MAAFGGESGNCPRCGVYVRFIQQLGAAANHTDTGAKIGQMTMAVCPNCQQIVLFLFDNKMEWTRFPLSVPTVHESVPARVAEAFREAQLALAAGAPHAAATMLRRTVASAATHFAVPDREPNGRFIGLARRIEALQPRLIPATYQVATMTKLLGDGGAHEEAEDENEEALGPVTLQTVGDALKVVSSVLQNLFELPAQVERIGKPDSSPEN